MAKGCCKLTGEHGEFLDAHIIPKALTRPAVRGQPLMQYGKKTGPVRRWDSWYDPHLVTRKGEDILTSLDTWAIKELRSHKLVWSGWGPMQALGKLHTPIADTSWGIRQLHGIDGKRLRLFFLSLLWRAAASSMPEFAEVKLDKDELERLRLMIVETNADPISFYPIQLTQLASLGEIHNQTPIATTKKILSFDNSPETDVPIFRFYFDGLAAHFHRQILDDDEVEKLGDLVVGAKDQLLISTVIYEESFQRSNLEALQAEAANWKPPPTRR